MESGLVIRTPITQQPPPAVAAPLAFQSSQGGANLAAGRAIDGSTATFSSTGAQANPWWALDMRCLVNVSAVVITLRSDAQYQLSTLHDLAVRAGPNAPSASRDPATAGNTLCTLRSGQLGTAGGQRLTLACTAKILAARYVTLQIRSKAGVATDVLSLAEVTVVS